MAPGLRIASSIGFLTDQAHLKVEEKDSRNTAKIGRGSRFSQELEAG
jgi:hypothetical protein